MLQQIDQTMSDSGILLQSIHFFPNGKSTVWGIYWEDVFFFGDSLSKSKN
jgi:hypothetical protein